MPSTSGFVEDVVFSHSGALWRVSRHYTATISSQILLDDNDRQVIIMACAPRTGGPKSAMYDFP